MHKQKTNGFTLVELIVVITILAILGTIAFISLQGYSTSARDSTRITDLGAMKTSLELFQLDAGKYPLPSDVTEITYSGAVAWSQGTFGETVYANTDKLDKIPLDPITDKQYTYSTTSKRNEFQLAGIIEGGDIAYNGPTLTPPYQGGELAQKANAGTTEAIAYITGNYNGQMTKSLSGETCNILAIPSIITNDTSITDLQQITSSQSFVYRGHKNLPSSFKGSKFKQDGGFEFSPNKLLAYTDTGSCTILSENTSTGITARVDLLKGLQDAYTGTTLKNEGEIKNILALDIDTNNPSTTVKNYASTFVNNVFGSKIVGSNSTNTNINNNTVLEHLTEITSLASIPEANKASFTVVSHLLYSGTAASYLFDGNLTNPPYAAYWFLGTHYVEIDVASDFRIWSIVTNFSDYNTYDASLKFINSNTLVEVPNTQTDHGRPNASQFRIASSTIPAGRYKVYTQLNSTRNNNQYRLDDEWFIEKMN